MPFFLSVSGGVKAFFGRCAYDVLYLIFGDCGFLVSAPPLPWCRQHSFLLSRVLLLPSFSFSNDVLFFPPVPPLFNKR